MENSYISFYAEEEGVGCFSSDGELSEENDDSLDGFIVDDTLDDDDSLKKVVNDIEAEYINYLKLTNDKQEVETPAFIDLDLLIPYFGSDAHKSGQCLLNSIFTAVYIDSVKKPSKAMTNFDLMKYYKQDKRLTQFLDLCEKDWLKTILESLQKHSDNGDQGFIPLNQIVDFVKSLEADLDSGLFVNIFLQADELEKDVQDSQGARLKKNRKPKTLKTCVKILHPEHHNPKKTPFNSVSILIKPEKN